MRIARFQPDHLKRLELQDNQQYLFETIMKPNYGPALALGGPCFTAFVGDTVLGCAGVIEFGNHRADVWALLSKHAGQHMRPITRAVNGWLDSCSYARIEAHVATDFAPGQRWIRLLGFHPEGPEKFKFFPDGQSALGFVRFRE